MDKIIDGRKWAAEHEQRLIARLQELNKKPKIVSFLVGDDPDSVLYSHLKQNKAKQLGISFELKKFSPRTPFETVVSEIKKLNDDQSAGGIMVQLPLPEEFLGNHEAKELLEAIDPQKDVDGLTGKGPFPPAVVGGVLSLLDDEDINVFGKKVTVLGSSDLVGRPVAEELKKRGANVEICDSETENIKEKILQAEVIVSATGVPHLVKGDMVSEGAMVIDVGTTKVGGEVMGDVDFDSVAPKASKITPVPGGVGPMNIISLMENVVELAERRN